MPSKKRKPVYVVTGSSGEYEDRRDWIVCAFTSERKAATLAEKLTAAAMALPRWDENVDSIEYYKALERAMAKAGDPHYQHDSSGASYGWDVVEVR